MSDDKTFPTNWLIAQDWDPNDHLMKLERWDKKAQRMIANDYLNVPNRSLWFVRDQRALIAAGLATTPYLIETELVELDRERGWALFKTHIRDSVGNEATMYGSEAAADFPDYIEKASTKSLGRALALLGYGTQYAPEMDEGERVVDAPQEQTRTVSRPQAQQQATRSAAAPTDVKQAQLDHIRNLAEYLEINPRQVANFADAEKYIKELEAQRATKREAEKGQPTQPKAATERKDNDLAIDRQKTSITMLCGKLGRSLPDNIDTMTFGAARDLLTQLSRAYSEARQAS